MNTTRLFVGASNRLWIKLGSYSRWEETDMYANDQSMTTIQKITHGTPLKPSNNRERNEAHAPSSPSTVVLSVVGSIVAVMCVAGVGIYIAAKLKGSQQYRSGEREALLGNPGGSYPPIAGEDDEQQI